MTDKPKRKRIVRILTDAVQGKGSWARVIKLTVKQMREARAEQGESDPFEFGVDLIKHHVRDWNWVDDDGGPMPSPGEQPDIVDDLTEEEILLLANAITGKPVEVKN